jgi:hypothetical protein
MVIISGYCKGINILCGLICVVFKLVCLVEIRLVDGVYPKVPNRSLFCREKNQLVNVFPIFSKILSWCRCGGGAGLVSSAVFDRKNIKKLDNFFVERLIVQ